MKRTVYNELLKWKNKPDNERKPLIIEGARQTGKTWLAREFGKNEFENFIEINFEENEQIRNLFEIDFNLERILMAIRSVSGKKLEHKKTLIFFDEIQHAKRGLLSLKYFQQNAPEYHIVAAGSLLGVMDHQGDSFPVGKVEFLKLYPLTFEEFLCALGKEELVSMLHTKDWTLIEAFENSFVDLLKQYYYVGGMPEVVNKYITTKDYTEVREVQETLLMSYERDFSKQPPKEIVSRMQILWNSIPSQLAKENKKFIYTAVRPSARARDFETSIQWLVNAGMAYKVTRVRSGELPLKGFEDSEAFKLYVLDIGLHGAMAGLEAKTLIEGNQFFGQYKGALTEQYVLQTIVSMQGFRKHYWTPDEGIAEVDFVVQKGNRVIPIEVKAEQNLRAKSLHEFEKRYKPSLIIRTSLAKYKKGDNILDLPLYAISLIDEF